MPSKLTTLESIATPMDTTSPTTPASVTVAPSQDMATHSSIAEVERLARVTTASSR